MAPEVVTGKYSELCDMWSVGVVFYQMVTGLRLWKDVETKEDQGNKRRDPCKGPQKGLFGGYSGYPSEDHFSQLLAETPLTLQTTAAWSIHGEGARDLAQEMLLLESQGRSTAAGAMEHDWLQKHALGAEQGCCTIS